MVYNSGMKPITLDYIAGFIDGEGYIGIIKKKNIRLKTGSQLGHYYVPSIKISQSLKNSEVLGDIAKLFGFGNFYRTNKNKKNQAIANNLEFRGSSRCKEIIDLIHPHLRVKQKQADVLLKFFSLPKPSNGVTDALNKERIDIDIQRDLLHKEIIELNKRGLAETK